MNKLYRRVELTEEEHYKFVFPHVTAMTGEKLNDKAEITKELGVRDLQIAKLKDERDAALEERTELRKVNAYLELKAEVAKADFKKLCKSYAELEERNMELEIRRDLQKLDYDERLYVLENAISEMFVSTSQYEGRIRSIYERVISIPALNAKVKS
tara:strand:+ start:674 stop:1141 length:468 start_codon:yes stop_codon:yes gene_type:complete